MLKRLLRWILRTVVMLLLLTAIVAISDYISHRVEPDSVLLVTMRGPVVERGGGGMLGLLNPNQTALNVLRTAIDRAAKDRRIVGLAIKVIDPEMELAQAQEIAALVKAFKGRGKWTLAYLESAGEGGPGNLPFLVAGAADEIALMPQGEINLIGVGVRELFARGTLDWLGITPNFGAMGRYKSAANMFTEKNFTAAQKEEDEALVDSMYDQVVAMTASERKLSQGAVKTAIEQAPLSADAGLKAHLVDRLEYEDEFNERVKNFGGREHKLVEYADYARASVFSAVGRGDKLAVIYGDGAIERGDGGFDPFSAPGSPSMTATDVGGAFKDARENDSVRAVVFRVNSPGGSVIASELIRREVELTAKKKPVVVSMSGYGASGGYWVSTPAAKIFAEPGTLTGSIGVLGGKFNVSPAATKIYANTAAVTRGANVEMFDMWTDFTPAQAKQFQEQMLGDTYRYFLKIVGASRHLSAIQVDAIAQGRVWTGEQAGQNKLIDSLGGFDEALAAAKAMARLAPDQEVAIVELPRRPSLLQGLASGKMTAAIAAGPAAQLIEPVYQIIRAALSGHGAFSAAYCPVVPLI